MKSKRKCIAVFVLSIFFLMISSGAWAVSLKERVKEFTLENGMKVLMLERHFSPTVSFYMSFKVGAVDEHPMISGTAHLLEHMLFKGTETLGTKNYTEEKKILDEIDRIAVKIDTDRITGKKADEKETRKLKTDLAKLQEKHKKYVIKDEIDSIYSRNGGVGFNASTGYDITRYKVSLPSNRVELWAKIEADRMQNPVLREFYSERDVVMEERRQRIDATPEGRLFENFMAHSFMVHPYRRPIIGWDSVLQFLNKNDTEKFFRTFYAPNNTVIAIVGDIDTAKVLNLIKRYFEDIPPQPLPPPIWLKEPEQQGERRVVVRSDANPRMIIGYHKPTVPDYDDYVFDVIDGILSRGRTSRFYKRLIEEKKIAVSIQTVNGYPGARFPNLFSIFATPRHPHTNAELEEVIYREIDRLKKEPVTERELRRIKNQLQADFVRRLKSNAGLASMLSYYQTVTGDWRYIENQLEIIEQVTSEDIMKVTAKYLTQKNRTVALLMKE